LAQNYPDHLGFGLIESELPVSGLSRNHPIPLILLVTYLHNYLWECFESLILFNGVVLCVKRTWLVAHFISEHTRICLADRPRVGQECRTASVRSRGRLYLVPNSVIFVGTQY